MLELPHTRLSHWLDGCLTKLGNVVSWLWVILLLVIVLNVVMRYFFGLGRIEFEEIQWHLYATGFLIGLSYAYVSDSHVRVDVVRMKLSPVMQAWIEFYGTILLLLPFVFLVLYSSFPFVLHSFEAGEISDAPGGLAFRWLIKSCLTVAFVLLLSAIIGRLSRVWSFLFGWPNTRRAN